MKNKILSLFSTMPTYIWLKWFISTIQILYINRNKNIRIGNKSLFNNVSFGFYNTFNENIAASNCFFGDFVYVGANSIIANASFGKFCSIGPGVKIGLGIHPTNYISTFPAFYSINKQCQTTFTQKTFFKESELIHIGNDVWIGANSIIMDGVLVGDGAIIAAGAIVTKNVPPYAIVGGIPAKIIRYRFKQSQIEFLQNLKWWDKEIEWIKTNYYFFNDSELFFSKFGTPNIL